jgi:hypothetical protein
MKRHYEKPAMRVVALQQRHHLLAGSGGMRGEISGYSKSGSGFSQDSEEPDNENDNLGI